MRQAFVRVCVGIVSLALPAARAAAQWEPVGLGGSGGMFALAVSPLDPRLMMVNCDMGAAYVSRDAGRTWIWQGPSLPWKNTAYALAFDPAVPGRLWAALSNTHDIPNDNVIGGRHRVIMQGGVAVSNDFGVSWKKVDLPAAPALSVVFDPTSPPDRRVLYASLFEKGVYKSSNGGKTWAAANQGLVRGSRGLI